MFVGSDDQRGTWRVCRAGEKPLADVLAEFAVKVADPGGQESPVPVPVVDSGELDRLAQKEQQARRLVADLERKLDGAMQLVSDLTAAGNAAELRATESAERVVELESSVAFLEKENQEFQTQVARLESAVAKAKAQKKKELAKVSADVADRLRGLVSRMQDQARAAKSEEVSVTLRACAKALRDELSGAGVS